MIYAVLAENGGGGFGSVVSVIIFAAIFIGSMILRARAETKARARRLQASEGEEEPQLVTPGVREMMRRIGREPAPDGTPVGTPPRPATRTERPVVLTRADIVAPTTSRPTRPTTVEPARPRGKRVTDKRARPEAPSARRAVARPFPAETPETGAAAPITPLAQLRTHLGQDLAGGPAALRKAILLSEILGPPRALRPLEDRLSGRPPNA